jgi:alpha-glucosidase (family GH31 glycosyl hydrolase)
MFYEFPELDDDQLATARHQFLLGPHLLAAPVLERGLRSRQVYLPEGEWYEFETGRRYAGNSTHFFETCPGYYPLFVRAGAILPVCPCGINAETSLQSGLTLEIFPGKNAKLAGALRLDDGRSNGVFKGQYLEQQYSGNVDRNGNISLQLQTLHKKYSPSFTNVELRLPSGYRVMRYRDRQIEGRLLDLVREDRMHSVYVFDLPLGTTNTPVEAEFEYRSNWTP